MRRQQRLHRLGRTAEVLVAADHLAGCRRKLDVVLGQRMAPKRHAFENVLQVFAFRRPPFVDLGFPQLEHARHVIGGAVAAHAPQRRPVVVVDDALVQTRRPGAAFDQAGHDLGPRIAAFPAVQRAGRGAGRQAVKVVAVGDERHVTKFGARQSEGVEQGHRRRIDLEDRAWRAVAAGAEHVVVGRGHALDVGAKRGAGGNEAATRCVLVDGHRTEVRAANVKRGATLGPAARGAALELDL